MNNKSNGQGEDATYPRASEALRQLAAQGYSITRQRRRLIDFVMSHSGSFTADGLLHDARGAGITVGRATLFRTLELLREIGFLSRVPDGDHMAYTACDPGHHHHLVCDDCGLVLHLDDCPVTTLLNELESRTGYRIKEHRLDVAGICPSCQLLSTSERPS